MCAKSIGRDEIGRAFRGFFGAACCRRQLLAADAAVGESECGRVRVSVSLRHPLAPRLLELEPQSLWFAAAGAAPSHARARRKVEPEDVSRALAGIGMQARYNQLRDQIIRTTECSRRTAQLAIREACLKGRTVQDDGQYRLLL